MCYQISSYIMYSVLESVLQRHEIIHEENTDEIHIESISVNRLKIFPDLHKL